MKANNDDSCGSHSHLSTVCKRHSVLETVSGQVDRETLEMESSRCNETSSPEE